MPILHCIWETFPGKQYFNLYSQHKKPNRVTEKQEPLSTGLKESPQHQQNSTGKLFIQGNEQPKQSQSPETQPLIHPGLSREVMGSLLNFWESRPGWLYRKRGQRLVKPRRMHCLSDLELGSPGKGEADVQSQQESSGCLCLPLAAKRGSTPQCQFSIPFSQKRLTRAFQKLQC